MRLGGRWAAALVLGTALSGCTVGATSTPPAAERPQTLVVAKSRSDVGNDRPLVSFDGLMVRRRIVVAFHVAAADDLPAVRRHIDEAAARRHTTLTPITPTVLDPVPLERLAPDLVLALPAGATLRNGKRLLAQAFRDPRWSRAVRRHGASSVLVHDLRFTVSAAHPADVARAIAREGILSDALGNYTTVLGIQKLDVLYTGPLLGDDVVHSVQVGMARAALVPASTVVIAPRSLSGTGVHLADEPTPTPVEISVAPHAHH